MLFFPNTHCLLSGLWVWDRWICMTLSPTDLWLCLYLQLGEDVICHKADLRFVSISGQKVLDSVQGALEQVGGSDPALDSTRQVVTDKLQDANHRYTALHTKVRHTSIHSYIVISQSIRSHTLKFFVGVCSQQSWAAVCRACWRGTSSTRMRSCPSTPGSALRNRTKA